LAGNGLEEDRKAITETISTWYFEEACHGQSKTHHLRFERKSFQRCEITISNEGEVLRTQEQGSI
jgi:hypothetical protein